MSSSIYTKSKWINSSAHYALMDRFFKDSPIIVNFDFFNTQTVFTPEHPHKTLLEEYQRTTAIDGKPRLVFGAWAGPQCCITNVIHEMGHLVEIDDARILSYGWGLRMPQQYIPGRYARMCPIPTTYKATLREVRTMVLQWQVQNMLGIDETPREILQALKFMPDFGYIPHMLDDSKEHEYKEYDEGRFDYLEKQFHIYMETYTLAHFHTEWVRKNELLRQRLT